MVDTDRAALRLLLVADYSDLSRRLARRLGSFEKADRALEEAYARLEDGPDIGPVRCAKDYLLRLALEIAATREPDPAAQRRSEVQTLAHALAELPERSRNIFKAVLLNTMPRSNIAERFGVSVSTVNSEVQRALEHGLRRLA